MTRRALSLALAAALIALGGCSSIPSSGPVHSAAISPTSRVDDVLQYAQDPAAGASAMQIVDGFVQALGVGADETSAFGTANKFLTAEAAARWKSSEVIVYRQGTSPRFTSKAENRISVVVDQVGAVDADGRYTENPPRRRTLEFTLRKVGGEWRIDVLPNIVIVSEPAFARSYQLASLYFPDLTEQNLVLESRYFPRNGAAQAVVRELLDGPSPWLAGAVHNPVPAGVTAGSVVVNFGQADVELGPGVQAASPRDRQLIAIEIETSLRLIGVANARLLVNNQEFTVDRPLPQLRRSVMAQSTLFFERAGRLMSTSGQLDDAAAVPAVPKLGETIRFPAVSHDLKRIVALDGDDALVQLLPADGGTPQRLLVGSALVPPAFDVHDWIWTAEAGRNSLTAIKAGEKAVIDLPWVAGRHIEAIAPARDGVRLALVLRESSGTTMYLVALTRDKTGKPIAAGEPLAIAGGLYSVADVAWQDDATLAVLGAKEAGAPIVPLEVGAGSQTTDMPAAPAELTAIASGRFAFPAVIATTAEGTCLVRLDTRWEIQANQVLDPTFSG